MAEPEPEAPPDPLEEALAAIVTAKQPDRIYEAAFINLLVGRGDIVRHSVARRLQKAFKPADFKVRHWEELIAAAEAKKRFAEREEAGEPEFILTDKGVIRPVLANLDHGAGKGGRRRLRSLPAARNYPQRIAVGYNRPLDRR